MVNAADGGGGGSSNYELDPDSLHNAITKLTQLADRVGTLKSNFASFQGSVSPSDWSSESSCLAFGQSYTSALSVYTQVITGMETDVKHYRDALQAALTSYTTSDDGALSRFNAAIAALDDTPLSTDSQGRRQYDAPVNHGNLDSDAPTAAPDTSPGQPGGAPSNGSGSGSGQGSGGTGGSHTGTR